MGHRRFDGLAHDDDATHMYGQDVGKLCEQGLGGVVNHQQYGDRAPAIFVQRVDGVFEVLGTVASDAEHRTARNPRHIHVGGANKQDAVSVGESGQ